MYYPMRYPQPPDPLREGEGYYSYWPPFHMSGKYALYMPVAARARLVMRETFSLSAFWDDVRTFGCTYAVLVGPLVRMLMLQPPSPDDRDNPLRNVMAGPLFPDIGSFMERFDVGVATGFGMTEVGGPLGTSTWEITDWQSCGTVKPGPPGFEIRVVDEFDNEVAPGEVGELVVRTSAPWALNAGYLGMPDKTAEAWRNGWFHTGDAFRYDENGNFYFVDRIKDAIRRRGENISSFEVENYVNEHPDVQECAAFGVPSELGEDEVKVCVVARPGSDLTPEQLVEFLAPRMPRFMVPRFVELVEELPKTEATARVRKVELKRDPLNDRTWDREKAGVALPR
jgi:crotonobetaine/carnitine-CoA ligase